MKSKLHIILAVFIAALFLAGCSSATKAITKADATLQAFDQLGLAEIHIPGRATSTHYTREEKDGVITSTLTHNNPSLSEPMRIVRKRPAAEPK